ncbi:DEAD/DEAH box helicase [Mycolicibacterium frederiksbergense]|uniref:DEAD/DEAH box helicase n=1 Tax=Mycolicibacterium frederiksbergense TaxID=117567 RepID=UPI00399B31A4
MSTLDQPSASQVEDALKGWVKSAQQVISSRNNVHADARDATARLLGRGATAGKSSAARWHFIPMFPDDDVAIRKIAGNATLPVVTYDDKRHLQLLTNEVAQALKDLQAVTGFGRLLLFGETRDKARKAERLLPNYYKSLHGVDLRGVMERATPRDDPRIAAMRTDDALAPWIGFVQALPCAGKGSTVEQAATFSKLPHAVAAIRKAAAAEAKLRKAALDAGNAVRDMETDLMLAEMAVERLKEATRDSIRVASLIENGLTSVKHVLDRESQLESLNGIGEMSARRIRGAARTLRQTTRDEMPMRIDIKNRTSEHTEFLRRIREWNAHRAVAPSSADVDLAEELAPVAAAIDKTVTHAIVVPIAQATVEAFTEAVDALARSARRIAEAKGAAVTGDPWGDFIARPADYFALLAELGFITEDDEKTHGDLPAEIIEAVRKFELKTDYLNASLRGYQSFGARFVLVQRKAIIGDEMGLGKTVESIAVLAHLRAKGEQNFIVVCPAAVVTNWVREVGAKSKLTPHRLHGPDRDLALKNWKRNGGVAVTTFETLRWLMAVRGFPATSCVVVDEAHYIKNPEALRSKRTKQLLNRVERAILLTGTPLENRLDEFRNLVGYLRPDLTVDANEFSPKKFRRQVAPAYLRRNQEDVLTELPELVEVDEWITMSGDDIAAYRAAVSDRNFMAMRQAAMKQSSRSAKMQRLIEIVDEAEANGRRVVVFSHFLDVLRDVADQLPGRVFGPLTGSVAASKRQDMVDDFSAAQGGGVLVAQILAGGVGLNIQAASVVVICEPQLKPTTEWQAIARAHRMGQLESVQVHRLLSDEGVDQRVREILARKIEIFESFARESDLAASAPEAFDVTEAEVARDIIAGERERLFGQPTPPDSQDPASSPSGVAMTKPRAAEAVSASSPLASSAAAVDDRSFGAAVTTPQPIARPLAADDDSPIAVLGGARSVIAMANTDIAQRQRTAREETLNTEARRSAANTLDRARLELQPYREFAERLPAISETPPDEIVKNVQRIVSVEGPITGWRLHAVYQNQSAGDAGGDFSKILNRAISSAIRDGVVLFDNPLNQAGNNPEPSVCLPNPLRDPVNSAPGFWRLSRLRRWHSTEL